MHFYEAEELLKRITYKPGWTFTLAKHGYDTVILRITGHVIDRNTASSYSPSYVTVVGGGMIHLWPEQGTEYFMLQVWDSIMRTERHEAMEFLRVDGELFCDPHDKANWQNDSMPSQPDFKKPIPEKKSASFLSFMEETWT